MASNGDSVASASKAGSVENGDRYSPLAYFFAIAIIVLVSGIYVLIEFTGLLPDRDALLIATTDLLLFLGATAFAFTSLLGFIRSRNLRIHDAMFGFCIASLAFCISGMLWCGYNIVMGVPVPYPSAVDLLFLAGSLAVIGSLYGAIRAAGGNTAAELNYAIIALAAIATVSIVVAYALFTDILRGGITLLALVSIVYPALDVICLALAANLIFRSLRRNILESQAVIAVGAVILSVTHIYYSVTASLGGTAYEPPIVTLYAVAFMLFATGIARYVDLAKFDLMMDRITMFAGVQKS